VTNQKPFKVKKAGGIDVALQITSMADIFIIILVFLLKSFAGGTMTVAPSEGVKLPVAANTSSSPPALTLEVSEKAIQVENTFVSPLTNFRFSAGDLLPNGIPAKLDDVLQKQRKRQELIAKSNSDVSIDSNVIVMADHRVPYSTMRAVLSAAAVHGFTDFKLVVVQKD
jgi:biopolymer transport protein ExbD